MPDDEPDDVLLPYLQTDHSVAIANVISAWAYFEYTIDELSWQLAGLEPIQGACFTGQFQTVAARFDALIALARVQKIPPKHINHLNSTKVKALDLAQKRNRLVHDPWFFGYSSKAHYRLQRTAKSKLDYGYKEVTIAEIRKFDSDIVLLRHNAG